MNKGYKYGKQLGDAARVDDLTSKIGSTVGLPEWLTSSISGVLKLHDDQLRQSAISVRMPPYNASPTNTAEANTIAMQAALDTGRHVLIPDGNYPVNKLTLNTDNQLLIFNSKARISSSAIGDTITLNADYAGIIDGYIIASATTGNAIIAKKFRNRVSNCTVTGSPLNCLTAGGLETMVLEGKYRGAVNAAINVTHPDCFLTNVYVENSQYGLHSNGTGSITAYHVHAFHNSKHGFYLVGANYSQLSSCYSDTNGQNGYELRDCAEITMVDCWGYKSADQVDNCVDFALYNAKKITMVGCRSNGDGGKLKMASFTFNADSHVELMGCSAVSDILNNNSTIRFHNCLGALARYNRNTTTVITGGQQLNAGATQVYSVKTLIPPIKTTPGIMAFDVAALIRFNDNLGASVERFTLLLGVGVTIDKPVNMITSGTSMLSITSPTFTDNGDGYHTLSFSVTNTHATKPAHIAFNLNYLGTGRGYV